MLLTFSFQSSLLFFTIYRLLGRTRAISMALPWAALALQRNQTTDVAEKLGKSLSGAQRTSHGIDFELILMLEVTIWP